MSRRALPGPLSRSAGGTEYTHTISSNASNQTVNLATFGSPTLGAGDTLRLIINSGVYVYSTSTATPALTIAADIPDDVLTIELDGAVIGMGGDGADDVNDGGDGGPALRINQDLTIEGDGYLGGGGGGGGSAGVDASNSKRSANGGGGAGGGDGGREEGGAGATTPNTSGSNGSTDINGSGSEDHGDGGETGGGGGAFSNF